MRQVAELAGARESGGRPGPAPAADHRAAAAASTAAEPIVRVIDAAVYLRPARGGLMFGGFEADPAAARPAAPSRACFSTDDVPLDLGVLRDLAGQVAAEAPLAVAGRRPGRPPSIAAGLFTMSPDGRFVAGPVPDVPGLWVASGCNGSGFSSSLAIGEALASWIWRPDRRRAGWRRWPRAGSAR